MDNSPFGLLKIRFLLGQTYGRFNSSICYAKRMDKPIDNLMNNLIAYGLENRKRFPTSYRYAFTSYRYASTGLPTL